MELKQIIANNITNLRKENKLTQGEFAKQLNYTDKAISKWERAESVPSIEVLKQIADMFNVTVDYLLHPGDKKDKEQFTLPEDNTSNKIAITLLAVSIVWIAVTLIYAYAKINTGYNAWQLFVWGVPISCVVASVFNQMWGKRAFTFYINSVFIWSLLTCLYLQYIKYNIWLIFIVGVPIQIATILWSTLKPTKKSKKKD